MTKQKKKMLKAKIAAALYHENGKVPTPEEIAKWTKFAQVLYTAVLGLHFERNSRRRTGNWRSFNTRSVSPISLYYIYDLRIYPGFNRQADHRKPAV